MRPFTQLTLCAFLIVCTACCSVSPETRTDTALQGAASNPSSSQERIGAGFATAIVIPATNDGDGVKAEYEWIRENLPGSHSTGQSLAFQDGKPYDIVHVECANGEKMPVYFDVSSFYGKPDGVK